MEVHSVHVLSEARARRAVAALAVLSAVRSVTVCVEHEKLVRCTDRTGEGLHSTRLYGSLLLQSMLYGTAKVESSHVPGGGGVLASLGCARVVKARAARHGKAWCHASRGAHLSTCTHLITGITSHLRYVSLRTHRHPTHARPQIRFGGSHSTLTASDRVRLACSSPLVRYGSTHGHGTATTRDAVGGRPEAAGARDRALAPRPPMLSQPAPGY